MQFTVKELIDQFQNNKIHIDEQTIYCCDRPKEPIINIEGNLVSREEDTLQLALTRDLKTSSLIFWRIIDPINNINYQEDEYQLIDGVRRFLCFYNFIYKDFITVTINNQIYKFTELPEEYKDKIYNFTFDVQILEGTLGELASFLYTVNTSARPLTPFEILRRTYQIVDLREIDNFISTGRPPEYDATKVPSPEKADFQLIALYLSLGVIDDIAPFSKANLLLAGGKSNFFNPNDMTFLQKFQAFNILRDKALKEGKFQYSRRSEIYLQLAQFANKLIDNKKENI